MATRLSLTTLFTAIILLRGVGFVRVTPGAMPGFCSAPGRRATATANCSLPDSSDGWWLFRMKSWEVSVFFSCAGSEQSGRMGDIPSHASVRQPRRSWIEKKAMSEKRIVPLAGNAAANKIHPQPIKFREHGTVGFSCATGRMPMAASSPSKPATLWIQAEEIK